MKLKDYFQEKKNYKINEKDKFLLYEKILSQKHKKSFQHILNIKYFVYGFITIVLLIGIYGIYFLNDNSTYQGFSISHSPNKVNADYIAQIVEFNGDFFVKHDGKIYKTSHLTDGDHVILKKGAEIMFNLNSGTKAKITGPAKFSLQTKNDGYEMLISEGDYIQMESTQTNTRPMTLVMDDFTISSDDNTNFTVTKVNDKYKIDNKGNNIKITKKNNTTEIKSKQLVAVDKNDITLIQNAQEFEVAFTKQQINQTFEIKTGQDIGDSLIDELSTNQFNSKGKNDTINTGLAKNLGIVDSKQIPSESQNKQLYSALDQESLMANIEDMWKSKTLGNKKDYQYAKGQIDSKIDKIYKSFDIKNSQGSTIENIKNLINELKNNYHIPNSQITKLETLINWISEVDSKEFGDNHSIGQSGQTGNDILQTGQQINDENVEITIDPGLESDKKESNSTDLDGLRESFKTTLSGDDTK